MIVCYCNKELSDEFVDSLKTHLTVLFPGDEIEINNTKDDFFIHSGDSRFDRRVRSVVLSLINLCHYTNKEY